MERPRQRLGELLVSAGFLTEEQLGEALEAQAESGSRIGAILVDQGYITATKLTQVLSHQLSLPWVSLGRVEREPELLSRLPRDVARKHRAVPVYARTYDGQNVLFIATDDPTSENLAEECARASGATVRLMVAAPAEIDEALQAHYRTSTRPPRRGVASAPPTGAVMVAASIVPPRRPTPPPTSSGSPSVITELSWDEIEEIDAPWDREQVVMLVHAPAALAERCRVATERAGVRLEESDLLQVPEHARQFQPIVIVVTEDVYSFDRVAFNELAMKTRAHLVIWSDDIDGDYLEPLIATARDQAR